MTESQKNRLRRAALIAIFIDKLNMHRRWSNEYDLLRLIFFAQVEFGVKLFRYNYFIRSTQLFSFDFQAELKILHDNKTIIHEYHDGWVPVMTIADNCEFSLRLYNRIAKKYKTKINNAVNMYMSTSGHNLDLLLMEYGRQLRRGISVEQYARQIKRFRHGRLVSFFLKKFNR